MKVYATLTNPKGNRKGMGSDIRVMIELAYKNKVVGVIGLYPIWKAGRSEAEDLGYRVVWQDPIGGRGKVIKEEEKGKLRTGEARCKHGVIITFDDCLNCDKGE